MKVKEAVMAFSQSEKLKAGLIWASHLLESTAGLPESESQGARRMVELLLNMVSAEVHLGRNLCPGVSWDTVEHALEQAMVMVRSGVGPEAVWHLTRTLSAVTTIGQKSMSLLKEESVL